MNPFNMSPKQIVLNMMNNKVAMNNPTLQNAMDMVGKGDMQGVEQLARQVCKTKGIDADAEFEKFKKQFGM